MENSELISKALSYISREYKRNEISIDDVATHAGFSHDYFNRIFLAHTGFNVMEYVRFTRLKTASRLLRTTSSDILNIALDCGYESHESFSRAFKKQYGLTPAEYRKKYERIEAYYGDFYNDTVGPRLVHEFKDFKIAPRDEVIDYLLETDALRYGYAAVCFQVNGGAALYDGEDFRDGFIWFTEWQGHTHPFEGDIFCDDWGKIAKYLEIFSDDRFAMIIFSQEEEDTVKAELAKHGRDVSLAPRAPTYIYTGEPYAITPPDGVSMRELTYDDYDLVMEFYKKRWPGRETNSPRLTYLKQELHQRDILQNSEHSVFIFGLFKDGEMIGFSDGGLQRTHGFVVNNCVVTCLMAEFETEEVYEYAFKFVTNAALEKCALPVDDVQIPSTPVENRSGRFNSVDLGYRKITNIYLVE